MKKFPLVAANDHGIRPAGLPNACFYCHQKVGKPHEKDCVIVKKKVKLKVVIEIDVDEPHSWDERQIENYYNKGTWCADSISGMIEQWITELNDKGDCLCDYTEVIYLDTVDSTPRIPENENKNRTGKSNEN